MTSLIATHDTSQQEKEEGVEKPAEALLRFAHPQGVEHTTVDDTNPALPIIRTIAEFP